MLGSQLAFEHQFLLILVRVKPQHRSFSDGRGNLQGLCLGADVRTLNLQDFLGELRYISYTRVWFKTDLCILA